MTQKQFTYEDRPIKQGRRLLYLRVKKERFGTASQVFYSVRNQPRGKGKMLYRTTCILQPASMMAALERIQRRIGAFSFVIYIPADSEINSLRNEAQEQNKGIRQMYLEAEKS